MTEKILPLENIRVLDFTNNTAGPCAAVLLAERGAEVIHIEKPLLGDDSRYFAPVVDGTSCYFMQHNRGKKSVVLDLKEERVRDVVRAMVKDADVLLESNRPGAMERLGLDYETLREINPRLIYCSVSAFGQTGPYASRPGYDIIAQAFSGLMECTGDPNGPPTKIGTYVGDYVGAINAFGSIMMALYQRTITGVGQHIDISLARGLVWMNSFFDYPVTGAKRGRAGNHDTKLAPYGIFNGPNRESIVIGAVNAATWKRLCQAMGREELADDPRYRTTGQRAGRREELIPIIEQWLGTLESVQAACDILDRFGVPNCKVYAGWELPQDEHIQTVDWVQPSPVPDSVTAADKLMCCVGLADFSDAGLQNLRAPDLGEHDQEILSQYGMSEEEIKYYESLWLDKSGSM